MKQPKVALAALGAGYGTVRRPVADASESAPRSASAAMIGRHSVEFERSDEDRAAYGTTLIPRLATDTTHRFRRASRVRPTRRSVPYACRMNLTQFSRRCLEHQNRPAICTKARP